MTRFLGSVGKYCSRKHIDLRLKTVLPSRTSSITLTGREECVEYNGAGPAVAICFFDNTLDFDLKNWYLRVRLEKPR